MFTMIYYKTKAYYSVVFMLNNKIIWINIYQDDFTKAFKAFNSVISTIKYNYQTSSTSEQIKFSQIYLEFFEKTIDLFKYYFNHNNLLLLDDTRLIVIYTLKCNILQEGMLLYELYLAMKKLKNSNKIIPYKYITNNYIDIFEQINIFFEEKLKQESDNAFLS